MTSPKIARFGRYTIDTDIYGESLAAGYYPMRIKSITLTSGACLALIESV